MSRDFKPSGADEQLRQIAMSLRVWDGNLISKGARDYLVEQGLVRRADGWNIITTRGIAVCKAGLKP